MKEINTNVLNIVCSKYSVIGIKDAIMLKVWRKDAVEKLIKLVTDSNNKYFKNELFVQPNK